MADLDATAPGPTAPVSERHPAAALRDLDRRTDRRLSQSFLTQPAVAHAMVRAAELGATDTVLEIGPGLGIVTRELLDTGARVVCVEVDPTFVEALPARLGAPPTLTVVQGDALTVAHDELVAEPYLIVASLPYHIASPVLFKFLFTPPRPRRIVAMLQLEVANRIVPRPGAMTFLSAAIGTVADARIMRRVAPGSFFPVPKVWSAVIRLDLHPEPMLESQSLQAFVEFLRAGFTQPRKQLHNSLAQGLGLPVAAVLAAAEAAGIDPRRRPGDLDLPEWAALYAYVLGPKQAALNSYST